ncbi:MAG: hypothetical protein ABIU95_08520 [Burkholderiales bacterium]
MATAHPEFDRFLLRHFLESLPAHEIERHDAPVDLLTGVEDDLTCLPVRHTSRRRWTSSAFGV